MVTSFRFSSTCSLTHNPVHSRGRRYPSSVHLFPSLLLSHFDSIDNNRDILPLWRSCHSGRQPSSAFMTMRSHGVTMTSTLWKQSMTMLSHTTPQTSLALIGRDSSVIVRQGSLGARETRQEGIIFYPSQVQSYMCHVLLFSCSVF